MTNNILGTSIAVHKAGHSQKELEMSEYYKIKYTIHGDAAKIRSVIVSCVNEDVAMANFKMAFIGHSPSIVSIEWVPRPGSMVVAALAQMEELAPMPEPVSAAVRRQSIWRQIA